MSVNQINKGHNSASLDAIVENSAVQHQGTISPAKNDAVKSKDSFKTEGAKPTYSNQTASGLQNKAARFAERTSDKSTKTDRADEINLREFLMGPKGDEIMADLFAGIGLSALEPLAEPHSSEASDKSIAHIMTDAGLMGEMGSLEDARMTHAINTLFNKDED